MTRCSSVSTVQHIPMVIEQPKATNPQDHAVNEAVKERVIFSFEERCAMYDRIVASVYSLPTEAEHNALSKLSRIQIVGELFASTERLGSFTLV